MGKTKNILFCGYYGQHNAGDDAFNAVTTWGAKKYWGAEEFTLLSESAPKIPFSVKTAIPAERKFKGYQFLMGVKEVIRNTSVVYGGGSILHSKLTPRDFSFYTKIMSKVGAAKIKGLGVSLGPFKSVADYESIKRFVGTFDFLGLRDKKSLEIAQSMRLKCKFLYTFDLAVLLSEMTGVVPHSEEIGVSVCGYETLFNKNSLTERTRLDRIYRTLLLLSRRTGRRIVVFVYNTSTIGDLEISQTLNSELLNNGAQSEIVVYDGNPLSFYERVSRCSFFLGVRLHSAIFAYSAGIPFMLVEYHRKCTDFLDDVGYPLPFRAPAEFKKPDYAIAEIEQMLSVRNVEEIVSLSPAQARERARLNFTETDLC